MQPKQLLADDEKIVYRTGKHWAVLVKAVIYLCLALALLVNRENILKCIPYSSAYEAAHAVTEPQAQTNANSDRILPAQTMQEAKHYATLAVTGAAYAVWAVLAVILALLGVTRALGFFTRRVIITTKRIIDRDTLLGALTSLSLTNVESARVASGIFGPVLGYGKVVLGMSSGQKISLANLQKPAAFERELFGAK